jgi:hypothetical protein
VEFDRRDHTRQASVSSPVDARQPHELNTPEGAEQRRGQPKEGDAAGCTLPATTVVAGLHTFGFTEEGLLLHLDCNFKHAPTSRLCFLPRSARTHRRPAV